MKTVTISAFCVGKLRFELAQIYDLPPDHPYAGQSADVPIFGYHIALPGRSVLVDAVDYDLEEMSSSLKVPGYVPPPPLLKQLSGQGIDPAEVSDVIITHAHFDHFGALSKGIEGGYEPSFPQARHYLSRADWDPEDFDDFEERTLGLVAQRGLLHLIDGEADLGDGLTLSTAPGEAHEYSGPE